MEKVKTNLILTTPGLILRPFKLVDQKTLTRILQEKQILDTTLLPIENTEEKRIFENNQEEIVLLALELKKNQRLIGGISLKIDFKNQKAALDYWLKPKYWNQGLATQAATEVIKYGFEKLKLNRIYAQNFKRNLASSRVLTKLGLIKEACLKQAIKKNGIYEDINIYSILAQDWYARVDSNHRPTD